jgi:serine/threonine protein phosphatase 1
MQAGRERAMRIYAIGDIHGRADLLGALLAFFARESLSTAIPYRVLFLGDVIDRGPQSREAMDLVVATLRNLPGSRLLLGNHEDFVLRFVDNPFNRDYGLMNWMCNGGVATALSYGVAPAEDWHGLKRMIPEMLAALEAHPEHVGAMRAAERLVVDEGHVFVHAGLRPGTSLKRQSLHDLTTIRSEFLDARHDFGLPVVHGHTITPSGLPEVHNYRIALDTGAEETGRLTAAAVENGAVESFLWTSMSPSSAITVEQVEPVDLRSDDLLEEAFPFISLMREALDHDGFSKLERH